MAGKKRKKKRSGAAGAIVTVLILLLLLGILTALVLRGDLGKGRKDAMSADSGEDFQMHYVGASSDAEAESETEEETEETEESTSESESLPVEMLSDIGVYSEKAMMIRLRDGAVFFDRASGEQMYPASMTKIMTCILAIENIENLDETITIKQEYVDAYYKEGPSRAGFEVGEIVTLRDCLYGIMLPSGAEACIAICDKVAGGEEAFVEMMNAKAAELGMENTHFVNSIGLSDEEHYSTCADFIKLEQYALQNELFKQIMTTRNYTTSRSEQHPSGITLSNTCFAHLPSANLPNGAVFLGGKTGYTEAAGTTLASIAKYGEDEYILVTAGGFGVQYAHITDAQTLYGRLGLDQSTITPIPTPVPEEAGEEASQ